MANSLKTVLLLGALSGLLLIIGDLLGGQVGLVAAFVIAVSMNFGSYWFSDKIVLRMYKAKEVGQEHSLYQMVARLTQRAGLPMPKVYIIPTASPNAFATGANHHSIFTRKKIPQITIFQEALSRSSLGRFLHGCFENFRSRSISCVCQMLLQ